MTQFPLALNDAPLPLPTTCTLYLGDCLEVMPRLKPMSVAMVFADLPYGNTRNIWDVRIPLLDFWAASWSLLEKKGAVIATASQPFATLLIHSEIQNFNSDIIWKKTSPVGFLNSKRCVLRAHEHILIFRKKSGTYNAQMTDSIGPKIKFMQGSKKTENYGKFARTQYDCKGVRYPTSVQTFSSRDTYHGEVRTIHPTQKPVALLDWLVKTYTNPGDTVLDPVFGSCTTGVACARLGRNFIGIEKDPDYFRIGTERVNAERAKLGLQPCEVR